MCHATQLKWERAPDLVQQRLARPGGHDDESVAASQDAVHHLSLVGSELLMFEHCAAQSHCQWIGELT